MIGCPRRLPCIAGMSRLAVTRITPVPSLQAKFAGHGRLRNRDQSRDDRCEENGKRSGHGLAHVVALPLVVLSMCYQRRLLSRVPNRKTFSAPQKGRRPPSPAPSAILASGHTPKFAAS